MWGKLQPGAADELQAGLTLGYSAGSGLRRHGERAIRLEVRVGGLFGPTIHRHQLALRIGQTGDGTCITRIAVSAEPFARVQVVSTPVAGQGINRGWTLGVRTAAKHVAYPLTKLGANAACLGVIAPPIHLSDLITRSTYGVAG